MPERCINKNCFMIRFIFRNSWWAKRKRPKIRIWLTLFDLIIEIAGLVAVLAIWILLLATYSRLPDVIPIHFNSLGQVDNFGEKSEIFMIPAIATVLFVGMTILSRFPHVFNYPVKITENNAFMQYRNAARMIRCLNLSIVLVFEYIVLHTVLNTGKSIGIWFAPFSLALIFVPVIYFMVKSFIYR
jgi:uncharacterized membrane protein